MNDSRMSGLDKLANIIRNEVGKATKNYFENNQKQLLPEEPINKLDNNELKVNVGIEEDIDEVKSLYERANERETYQSQKRQINVEKITNFASDELKNEDLITPEPVDDDWTSRFFSIVEDVSNEEMQAIWGKILAGEIKQPKSYSLRTLEVIRNLSKEEATTFIKIANFAIEADGVYFIFRGSNEDLRTKFNISFPEITLMVELGIIQPGDLIHLKYQNTPTTHEKGFIFGSTIVLGEKNANTPEVQIPLYLFTRVGTELLKLASKQPPFDYLKFFAEFLQKQKIKVSYSIITGRTKDLINYRKPTISF
ncbi:hypothetical protein GCM10027049_19950 [Mucilaginibacter puniceus]